MLRIGRLSLQLGEGLTARAWLERATALAPDDPQAWLSLAEAGIALGDRPAAQAALTRASELVPDDRAVRALARRLP